MQKSLAEEFLSITTTNYYNNEPSTNTTHPLLSISITMDIQPSTKAQKLHRDDKNHHARHPRVDSYHPNRDMLLGLFVPNCDTTREIGATRVVPGSHLWGDEMPEFIDDSGMDLVVDAELKAGEAMIMLGSLYHGGGQFYNSTGSRMVHIMFMCSGIYRQEVCVFSVSPFFVVVCCSLHNTDLVVQEISYLSYPTEDVKTYSKLVQQRLGWQQSEPNLGWVDLQSPEVLLE